MAASFELRVTSIRQFMVVAKKFALHFMKSVGRGVDTCMGDEPVTSRMGKKRGPR